MNLDVQISQGLQLPVSFIRRISKTASHWYKIYSVPKKSGGTREIFHPARELKAIQRWLLAEVIEKLPVHSCAFGYRRGIGIKSHAMQHVGGQYLLRLDFENFFPSISAADITAFITKNPEKFPAWGAEDVKMFCDLVCHRDRLTIGAPSSPALANALCEPLDRAISVFTEEHGVTYTRYADDLFFSTNHPDVLAHFPTKVAGIISSTPIPANLRINASKTIHTSKKVRRRVTGLVITNDGKVSIGREAKRKVRGELFRLSKLSVEERNSLAGMLAYIRDVEPEFFNRLVLKYRAERVEAAQDPSIAWTA